MSTSITVETADLRQALTAVGGHASAFTDDTILRRVRLEFDQHHVTVVATNRYSAGLAIVSVWVGDIDPDHQAVDLTPTDIAQLLAVFHGTGGKDGEMGDTVRLDVDVEHLTITDTGGLFEGKSLTLPRLPMHESYPSVGRLMRAALTRELPATVPTVWVDPRRLVLFKAAGVAYAEPLVIEATGAATTLVVRCGESFVGLLMPMRPGDDVEAQARAWRQAWLDRLPGQDDDVPDDQPATWLREGNGITVSWTTVAQDDIGVSVGDGMRDDARTRLADALRLVVESQFASASMLKRKLRLPVAAARELIDSLEGLGVVGPATADASGSREVLVAPDDVAMALDEHGLSDAVTAV